MLISIHVHTDNPFGFLLFVPSLFCSFFQPVFFPLRSWSPLVLVPHFHLHDITCRWWGAWAFGEPGCSGPQNHPLLAPLVQFASATPVFQTSCPLLSLPQAGVQVSWSSVCYDGPIILPLGVSPHIPNPQFSCGALN
uniref:Uncharacterized protein n=1 Tax=Molossus molossus TaxID=27622 RepID=A0A7J8D019_MOLMO|nr:hypothetical protein HJG59_009542 [Molossus molossus]